ncbi:tigger transposable element-derived protein 6-like, partial [Galendromus occidentalis]|uniref:Tigger transposable element-derived protein 6-like n=1 Tax=Galendromus occidentalis TaxID=34638 RepID=A0AAJ6QM76_9ACAR
ILLERTGSTDDVYNADETGLFFQLLPERSLTVRGETCAGGKKSKVRLTALLCCNASGTDKRKLFVIGKSAKPRCLKNVRSLPCLYRGNKRAWMTRELFSEWLLKFDRQMKAEKRNVLLLLDNCSAHNVVPRMTNIRVEYFPPNCTSILQPLDLGIIRAVKARYRKSLIRLILVSENAGKDTKVDVRQAMKMLSNAWSEIIPTTIRRCWEKSCVFSSGLPISDVISDDHSNEDYDPTDLWQLNAQRLGNDQNVNFDDYVTADDDVHVCEELSDACILKPFLEVPGAASCDSSESDEDPDGGIQEENVSIGAMLESMSRLKRFVFSHDNVPDHIFKSISGIENFVLTSQTRKMVQTKLTDFVVT